MRALPQLTGRFRRLYYALFVLSVSCACVSSGQAAPPLPLVPRAILVGVHAYTPTVAAVFPLGLTDGYTVYNVPSLPRPAYMSTGTDPTFGTALMRIGGTVGTATAPVAGVWGMDARHVYSKQQPWNSDQTLISMQNRSGGAPSVLLLDGNTYQPLSGPCSNYDLWDYRWHPSRAHPHEQINVNKAGTELMWFDVTTCTKTRSWTLPIAVDYGIGSGEGNPSFDGRFVVLGNDTQMFVVDMDPQPPFAPYPNQRVGPVYTIPPCNLDASDPGRCVVDNLSVSPSGKYVDVQYDGLTTYTSDAHRIFEIDPTTLALRPHLMAMASQRCDGFESRNDGWIFPIKHADMTLDPFDNMEDVMVGGRHCPSSSIGGVVMVRLRDGKVTALTDPANECYVSHVSTRNTERLGWAYVSYGVQSGKRFNDEIVAVKLDGSGSVERMAHKHTASSGCYRCESHAVPSPDGARVIFASNWSEDCVSCPSASDIKDYVVWKPASVDAGSPPMPGSKGLALRSAWPNPATTRVGISYSLEGGEPAEMEIVDARGRVLWSRDLGSPGPGVHTLDLERDRRWMAGVYWLRLSQAGREDETKVTFLR